MRHLIYNGIKECNCLTCRELAATKRELVDFQLAAHAEAERVDELTKELAATKRELEHWKHGTQREQTLQGIPIPVPASARGPERDGPPVHGHFNCAGEWREPCERDGPEILPAQARVLDHPGPVRHTSRSDEPTVVRRLTKAMRFHLAAHAEAERVDEFSRSGYACTLTLEPVGDGTYRMVVE